MQPIDRYECVPLTPCFSIESGTFLPMISRLNLSDGRVSEDAVSP